MAFPKSDSKNIKVLPVASPPRDVTPRQDLERELVRLQAGNLSIAKQGANLAPQRVDREWLEDQVSEPRCPDGVQVESVRREQRHRCGPGLLEQIGAVGQYRGRGSTEAIGEHEIESDLRQQRRGVRRLNDRDEHVALILEDFGHDASQHRVVLNQQDAPPGVRLAGLPIPARELIQARLGGIVDRDNEALVDELLELTKCLSRAEVTGRRELRGSLDISTGEEKKETAPICGYGEYTPIARALLARRITVYITVYEEPGLRFVRPTNRQREAERRPLALTRRLGPEAAAVARDDASADVQA